MPRATPAINATHVLARLCDQAASDLTLLETSLEDFGEAARQGMDMDEAPVNPIMDKFVNVLGPEGIRSLTNFTVSEIESLWSIVDDALNAAWLEGRGRKSTTSPKNRLFTLTVMKQFCSWDKHAADFSFKAPTFEKMIMRTVSKIEPVLSNKFIVCPSMATLTETGCRFTNYPYALYAVDVKFQPSLRPTGRFSEQKHYFSGKHHLYGYKIETAVSPDGRCVAMSDAHPGSVHDLTIMRTRRDVHKANLTKTSREAALSVHGELSTAFPTYWPCLVDMDYIRIAHEVRGIHPKRRPANGALDANDHECNRRVSSDRVVVENFFGRVCSLWRISSTTFTWGEKIYLSLQKTTFALTNFHLLLLPMLAEDENYYAMVLARYQRMASEKKRKRAETQHRYRLRRRSYRHGYQSRSFLAIQWLKYFQCSCILVKTN
ncbi:hypothetical protein AaE_010718 [Aphanomyces astaci]|uniref:DDE Tnp4 domain-containing protein n=1 Tax=Aphanomyces astaci TaxID=112090 RepID=A0A6A4ZW61_APHAT|nr:hypothetical protein AaE_010718 [Aphanomyces astaci]